MIFDPESTRESHLRRRAIVLRSAIAALTLLSVSLAGAVAVSGSDDVDSGWAVSQPNSVLENPQPTDPRLRIAIKQVLEQGRTPLLIEPAQIPADRVESVTRGEVDANGWRPANVSSDASEDDAASQTTVQAPKATDTSDLIADIEFAAPPALPSKAIGGSAPEPDVTTPIVQESQQQQVPQPYPNTFAIEIATPLPTNDDLAAEVDEVEVSDAAEPEPADPPSRVSAILPPPVDDSQLEPLSKQMQSLRNRMRRVLKSYYNRPLNSRDNDPWEMMHGMLAYGIHSRVRQGSPQGKLITSVGWLCYNKPCKGMTLLYATKQGDLRAKYGVGLQGHMGQFLAMLAQCHVSPDYPIRIGKREFTVADLIEAEKTTCYSKSELTFKLIALMHYCPSDTQWVNDQGVAWDIPKLIQEELRQPIRGAACGGTHRLAGLSLAARTRVRRNEPLDGEYLRAAEYVEKYEKYAFQMQNRDGSLSTQWFRGRGSDPDIDRRVKTTGHILEWLCYSLDDQEITDRRTFRAANYLTNLLSSNYNHEWEVGPVSHALHALKLYDERVFQPYDDAQEIVLSPDKRSTARRTRSNYSRSR